MKFTEVLQYLIVQFSNHEYGYILGIKSTTNEWTNSLVSCWNVFNVYLLLYDFVCCWHWVYIWNVFQYRTCRMRFVHNASLYTCMWRKSWNIWKGHQDSRFTNYVAIDSVEMAKPGITFSRLCIGNLIKVAEKNDSSFVLNRVFRRMKVSKVGEFCFVLYAELISYPLSILFLRIFHDFWCCEHCLWEEVCHQQDDINENGCDMLPKNLKNSGIWNFLLMKYVIWVDAQSL